MAERHDAIDPFLLGASKLGGRMFRNNSGMAFHKDGSVVRYGVGTGGSDCLGWFPFHVKKEHVGQTVAVFTAVELKTGVQKPTREQLNFLNAVDLAGGIAAWGTDPQVILAEILGRLK